jgi:hypothetical protein
MSESEAPALDEGGPSEAGGTSETPADIDQEPVTEASASTLLALDKDKGASVPGKDATVEAWESHYGGIRPAEPSGYEFSFGEGVNADPAFVEFGQKAFYEAGLSQAQAQKVVGSWQEFVGKQHEAQAAAAVERNDAAVEVLKQEAGPNWDSYLSAGDKAVSALGLSRKTVDALDASAGTAPVLELLTKIGRKMTEPSGLTSASSGGEQVFTPDQAQAEIERLLKDPDFSKSYYTKGSSPEKQAAFERIMKLTNTAASGGG